MLDLKPPCKWTARFEGNNDYVVRYARKREEIIYYFSLLWKNCCRVDKREKKKKKTIVSASPSQTRKATPFLKGFVTNLAEMRHIWGQVSKIFLCPVCVLGEREKMGPPCMIFCILLISLGFGSTNSPLQKQSPYMDESARI